MSRSPDRTGIRRKGTGWQATVSRGHAHPRVFRFFPLDTPFSVIQAWRQDVRDEARVTRKVRSTRGMFDADAARYLRTVTALSTYKDRVREIHLWVEAFGHRSRADITAADIRAVRDAWLTTPRATGRVFPKSKPASVKPVSGATVNKRLRALSNLYTVLDGRHAPNPVRDVPELPEPTRRIRALPYEVIAAILAALPDRGRPVKGQKRPTLSHAKLRLTVMAYTGWPPATLQQLTPADIDLELGIAHLPARRKGKGAPAVSVPLLPEAVDALRDFAAADLWGPFDARTVNRAWKRAAKTLDITGIRAYDLRHSFLTAVGLASKDERAVQALAQHGDIRTTRGYTEGGVSARLDAALLAARVHMPVAEGGGHSDDDAGARKGRTAGEAT